MLDSLASQLPNGAGAGAGATGQGKLHRWSPPKVMHVSPFMPMEMEYDWRMMLPAEQLNIHMENRAAGNKVFDATLQLERHAITPASLRNVLLRFPFMTLRIIVAIHWQALRLWLKKTPIYDHPAKRDAASASQPTEGSSP